MTLMSGGKLEEKVICSLENDMRNLANFHQSTQKSQNCDWSRKCMCLKVTGEVMCLDNEERCKIWRGIGLPFQNWHEEYETFWP